MAAIAEQQEPEVALRQMTDGHNVIEDYSHNGLTLRQHSVAFLRNDLSARNIIPCAEAMNCRDGRWVYTPVLFWCGRSPDQ
jgi:error-prone DNA polymerase